MTRKAPEPVTTTVALLPGTVDPQFRIALTRVRGKDVIEFRTCWTSPVPQDHPRVAQSDRLHYGPDVFTFPIELLPALKAAIERAETISRQLASDAA